MVDIAGALQATGAAIGLLKEMSRAEREYDKADLKLKIAELSSSLATAQIALTEAQTDLAEKDREIEKLQEAFLEKAELVEVRGFSFRKSAEGKPYGKAYCPRCLVEGTLMQLHKTFKNPRMKACPECRREYQVSDLPYPEDQAGEDAE